MLGKQPITALDTLQLMLIYLKLSGQVDWSWLAVLTPVTVLLTMWLSVHVVKETLILINTWLTGVEYGQERETDQRSELRKVGEQVENGRSDSKADE